MNRTFVNLIIDLTAALLFLGMMATGYILHFPLPPGTNKMLLLWGLTRHQWGDIHFWLSLGFLGILFVHIVLHWQWIVTVIGKRLHLITIARPPQFRRSGVVVFIALITAFSLFAWLTHQSVQQITEPIEGVCPPEVCPPEEKALSAQQVDARQKLPKVEFWQDIYPIFEQKCLSCHGSRKQLGGFRIDRREEFFGDNQQSPLVVPGKSSASPLIEVVSGARKEMRMADRHKLPEKELSLVKLWIDQGAAWADSLDKGQ